MFSLLNATHSMVVANYCPESYTLLDVPVLNVYVIVNDENLKVIKHLLYSIIFT